MRNPKLHLKTVIIFLGWSDDWFLWRDDALEVHHDHIAFMANSHALPNPRYLDATIEIEKSHHYVKLSTLNYANFVLVTSTSGKTKTTANILVLAKVAMVK